MTQFFNKLPTISYNGTPAKNFLARGRISEKTSQNRTMYYPYTMSEDDRADILSHKYYDDADYAWLIWLTNQVVDPYYDVFLNDSDFYNYVVDKYGNIETAQTTILYYRNNWAIDESEISTETYEALPINLRKYYNALVDQYNIIYGYARRKEDWTVKTNQIVRCEIDSIDGSLSVDEKVIQTRNSNSEIVANGYVTFSNSTVLSLQHISGEFETNAAALTLTGSNGATITISSTEVNYSIPLDEAAFWHPVTAYEHEEELNFQRKEIQLIDNRYKNEMATQFKKLMST